MNVIFLEANTQYTIKTPAITNNSAVAVSGINYQTALPAGIEIVAAIDSQNVSINVASNVVGPMTIPAGESRHLFLTIGVSDINLATCPVNISGYYTDADACVIAGSEVHNYEKCCISCPNIASCLSAGTAQDIRTETADYTAVATDGVILADAGCTQVNFPLAPFTDQEFTVVDIEGAPFVTVNGNGQLINGAATYVFTAAYEANTFKYDGSAWTIIGGETPTDKDTITPIGVFDTAGDAIFTYNTQEAFGYQIGNLYFYTINLNFDTNAYTTAAGDFIIDGIPVTPINRTPVNVSSLENINIGESKLVGGEINTSGDIKISLSELGANAVGTLTLTGLPLDTETVVIGGTTYTFLATFVDAATNVHIGADANESLDNLISAITGVAHGSAVEGTDFPTGVSVNTDVTAYQGAGDTMLVKALTAGAAANALATTESLTNGSWADVTLVGGYDGGASPFITINEIPPSTTGFEIKLSGFFEI